MSAEPTRFLRGPIGITTAALVVAWVVLARANEPPGASPEPPPAPAETTPSADDLLRAYLRLQEQLHATQLALERNRQETLAAAMRTADTLGERLAELEAALQRQHRAELEAAEAANRMILLAAAALAALGVLAMVASAWLQTRAARRLTETVAPPPWLALAAPASTALGAGGPPLIPVRAEPTPDRALVELIERLEKRIAELERTAQSVFPGGAWTPSAQPSSAPPGPTVQVTAATPSPDTPRLDEDRAIPDVPALLREAEALLERQDTAAAVACYERVLARQPDHAEAWLQKGTALERQGQTTEALACYERAAAAPGTRTRAYVRKGALLNSLERYTEALECFEQARRAQETARAPA